MPRLIFNDRLDAVVTGTLIVMVALILIESAVEWLRVLSGRKQARVKEVAVRGHTLCRGAGMKDNLTATHVGTAAPGCPVERSSTVLFRGFETPEIFLYYSCRHAAGNFRRVRVRALPQSETSGIFPRRLRRLSRRRYEVAKARRPRCC